MYKNDISNGRSGVTCGGMSTMWFGKPGIIISYAQGNNTITENRSYGIMLRTSDFIYADPDNNANYNNISGNGGFDIGMQDGAQLHAKKNYWGSNPVFIVSNYNHFNKYPDCILDTSEPLPYEPSRPFKMGIIEEEISSIVDIPNLKKIVSNTVS
jgi:hypothetical protein